MLSGVVGPVESSQELSSAVVDGDVERNSILLAKLYESMNGTGRFAGAVCRINLSQRAVELGPLNGLDRDVIQTRETVVKKTT
jgi:hypothetical protein